MPAIFYHNKFTCIVNYLLRSFVNYVSWNKSPSLSFHTKQKGFLKVQTLWLSSQHASPVLVKVSPCCTHHEAFVFSSSM